MKIMFDKSTYNAWHCLVSKKDKVKVCQSWQDGFDNFLADMGIRPSGAVLQATDPSGEWCVQNCTWKTLTNTKIRPRKEITRKFLYRGVMMTPEEIAKTRGETVDMIYTHLKNAERKGDLEVYRLEVIIDGVRYRSLVECCEKLGKRYSTVKERLNRGWSLERALS